MACDKLLFSDYCVSNNWGAELAAVAALISSIPNRSGIRIYTVNLELSLRAGALFKGDRSALFNADGRPMSGCHMLQEALSDIARRDVKPEVAHRSAKFKPDADVFQALKQINRRAAHQ